MLTPQRYERLGELFAATCELPPRQRATLLDRECADDPSLRTEVEALLAKDADSRSFLESRGAGKAKAHTTVARCGRTSGAAVT